MMDANLCCRFGWNKYSGVAGFDLHCVFLASTPHGGGLHALSERHREVSFFGLKLHNDFRISLSSKNWIVPQEKVLAILHHFSLRAYESRCRCDAT
jgi:hypothetical protein